MPSIQRESEPQASQSLWHFHYHPVGSCKMGEDEMAVVDQQLRVRCLDGL
ncbi:GMC oxidoreductase [Mycobacterium sp.]